MNLLLMLADDLPPVAREGLLIWGGVIMAAAVVGCVAIMILKRRLMSPGEGEQVPGFSLSELREMRDRGEMTPEEYERTRARVIAKVKGKMVEGPKGKRGEKGNDGADSG
jgi:hypothetical protein